MRTFPVSLCALVYWLAAVESAHAWCMDQDYAALEDYAPGGMNAGDPIPVWIVTDGPNSLLDDPEKMGNGEGLGLTLTQIVAEVKAAARAYSETPAAVRLYYAGQVDSDAVQGVFTPSDGTPGIVIYSAGYNSCTCQSENCPSSGPCGSRIKLTSADTRDQNPANHFLWTTEPFNDNTPTNYQPLRGNLMHEMAHSFGMDHLHEQCDAETDDLAHETGPSDWNSSVFLDKLQNPRRDDIEGITYRFGQRTQTVKVYTSSTGISTSWTDESSTLFPYTMTTSVPPGASAASLLFLDFGTALIAASGGYYIKISLETGSTYSAWEYPYDGEYPRTWRRPSIAMGDDQVVIAWVDETNKELADPKLRYGVKDLALGTWDFTSLDGAGETAWFANYGIAYDTASGRYVAVLRDEDDALPKGGVLDLGAAPAIEGIEYLGGTSHVAYLGKPTCGTAGSGYGAFCVTPASRVTSSGPLMRFFKGHVDVDEYVSDTYRSVGYLDFGMDDLAGSENHVFVGSIADELGKAYLYRMVGYSGSPGSWKQFDSDYWPIAVGESTFWWFCSGSWCSSREFRAYVTQD